MRILEPTHDRSNDILPQVMTGPRPSSANVYHHGSPTSTFYTVPVMNGAQLNPKLVYAQPRVSLSTAF